jgi:hypothetical protein
MDEYIIIVSILFLIILSLLIIMYILHDNYPFEVNLIFIFKNVKVESKTTKDYVRTF